MGIFCEINLCKPIDGAFVPGETVSGTIKYTLDTDINISKTIVSLKGNGYLRVRDRTPGWRNQMNVFRNSEKYVDIDQEDSKGSVLPCGQYETNFSFKLPEDIPPSFNYNERHPTYSIRCHITYYVRIKFESPGLFQINKHFKKVITVISGLKPSLPTSPTTFGQRKKLFQPFKTKSSIVNIKASVENCVIQTGGKIELNYEIFNDTNVTIQAVETKLKEVHTFKPRVHPAITIREGVPSTAARTTSINSGESQNMLIIINVPSNYRSLEHSKLVSREYVVKITAQLPMPHINATLEIPVQVGDINCEVPVYSDPPPPYWQVMGEHDEKADEDINEKDDDE